MARGPDRNRGHGPPIPSNSRHPPGAHLRPGRTASGLRPEAVRRPYLRGTSAARLRHRGAHRTAGRSKAGGPAPLRGTASAPLPPGSHLPIPPPIKDRLRGDRSPYRSPGGRGCSAAVAPAKHPRRTAGPVLLRAARLALSLWHPVTAMTPPQPCGGRPGAGLLG